MNVSTMTTTTRNDTNRRRMCGVLSRIEAEATGGGSPLRKAPSLDTGGVTFACSACSGLAIAVAALQAGHNADAWSSGNRLPHFEQMDSGIDVSCMTSTPKALHPRAQGRERSERTLGNDR